ncbi:MAG TPA: hypothetical protein ENI80_08780 [Acidiferrobacteraceae bacterium]|nr:hypothetical protein [Acidiferrobacteraceae bacterium]
MKYPGKFTRRVLAVAITLVLPMTASADADYDALKKQVEQLQRQLQQVQEALKRQEAKVNEVKENSVTRVEAKALENEVNAASEWKDPNTLIHMAGYADVGYSSGSNQDGSFNVGSFSPIFHFQYKDKVMLESELEFEVGEDGETEVGMEYMTIDWFVNDYMAIVGGKFLSPVGQFRQNLHPSWINKLPSAPPGFGHDGAAPVSDAGLQVRGGFPIGNMRSNYAVFVSNGPELITGWEDGEFELDGIKAEGTGTDRDGEKVWGGRFAILPMNGLEVGMSVATGKATVTGIEDDTGTAPGLMGEQARDYDVFGFDAIWQYKSFALRGEYVKSKVGGAITGATASDGGEWKTWYAQASYLFPTTKFEGVIRYANFDTPHASQDQKQWALGLNYLFASNIIGKIAFESNEGQTGSSTDDDRWFIQMAYGF